MIIAIIGKNFGDEGKGLAADYFCARVPCCMVVKHNGGAQAGHTVQFEGRRFVFHQLSSGSFRGAKTFFASTYYPDFYKLREELGNFGSNPGSYGSADTRLIYPDDILINMALEESRGDRRHGSCGMGINEGFIRTKAGFGLYAHDVFGMNASDLARKMRSIREEYGRKRLAEAFADDISPEYAELLSSPNVLINVAEEMLRAAESVTLVEDEAAFLRSQENIVFESGQGLLLDSENEAYAPHVTASRTGLHNVVTLLKKAGLTLDESCYVTRTYMTRHGAGTLCCEAEKETIGKIAADQTNLENNWQGAIRYGKHKDVVDFLAPVLADLQEAGRIYPGFSGKKKHTVSLFVTHLNETDAEIVFSEGRIPVNEFLELPDVSAVFSRYYLSYQEENVV